MDKYRYLALITTISFAVMFAGLTACTQQTDPALEQRLQQLEKQADPAVAQRLKVQQDMEEIRSLLIAYGRALDKRDFEAYGKLFAADGEWSGGMGSAKTPEGIAKMVEEGFGRMSPELYVNSHHVMTSMDIRVNGDTATAWSRWMWVVNGKDGKPLPERSGHYEDVLIRENGQWRFKHRQAVTEITN